MSYENLLENVLIELKALMKTQEAEGYGKLKAHPSRIICEW